MTGTPEIGTNYNTYYGIGDLQPRFGFAWQPGWAPNTVLRGAYDISSFMEGNGISNMAVINPPNSILINQTNTSGANLLYPQYTLTNGYAPYQNACTAAELQALVSIVPRRRSHSRHRSKSAAGHEPAVEPDRPASIQEQLSPRPLAMWATKTTTCPTSSGTTRRF